MSPLRFTDEDLSRHADELRRDGVCVIRKLLPESLIRAWRGEFDSLVERRRRFPGGLAPRGPGRFYLTLPWTRPFADPEVYANAAVLGVLDRLFPQEYRMVQLATDTPTKGSDFQALHRDFRPLFSEEFPTPLYAVAVNFPLGPVTEENGPLQIARGTHRIPREEAMRLIGQGEIRVESILMEPGDVLIRTPFALHRGTPNLTEVPRPMVVMGYVMHWLHTPKVDLAVPRADYDALPENLRNLLRCEVVDNLAERVESYVEFAY